MTTARYIVLEHAGQWKINLNNQYFGPFPTREAAVDNATQGAREAAAQGFDARVMVMTSPGAFDTVWTRESEPRAPFA